MNRRFDGANDRERPGLDGGGADEPLGACDHPPEPRGPRLDPALLERAAEFFRAAGDPGRLLLLAELDRGERCVSDLAALTGEGMSTISQRLKVLRAAGLVTRRREHKHILYSLADRHITQLIQSALEHAGEPEPLGRESRRTHTPTQERHHGP